MSKDTITVENLNIDELDLKNEINDKCELSESESESETIFYSYPFLLKNKYEYQYRITIDSDSFYIDEVKCKEDSDDMSVVLISEIAILPKDDCLNMIKDNINLITFKKFEEFTLGLNDLPLDNNYSQKTLNFAREYCLYDLQNEILNS